jgi:hypothetical protein
MATRTLVDYVYSDSSESEDSLSSVNVGDFGPLINAEVGLKLKLYYFKIDIKRFKYSGYVKGSFKCILTYFFVPFCFLNDQ